MRSPKNYVDQLDAWVNGHQFYWPFSRTAVVRATEETLTMSPESIDKPAG